MLEHIKGNNMKSFFQVTATDEQVRDAKDKVDYSIKNHTVPNNWDDDPSQRELTSFRRFIGSLGETVFADAYEVPRHEKAYGADDGQDHGNDFKVKIDNNEYIIDLKSLSRKNDCFHENYVMDISSRQLHKKDSKTELYYHISIHQENEKYIVSFLGYVRKNDIIGGKVGKEYKRGTKRIRGDGSILVFPKDTYEVEFKDLIKPAISEHMRQMNGFRLVFLK